MKKPTIFFSHCSQDSKALTKLRDLILGKTGNSVQIFLSSDGQSIPFGRNWVHSVEEALNDSKLMFVFLSPAALARPGWINFESGHAYSRGIKVIPVGVFGVQIENLTPPLSLLQGFNIKDISSASNIIATINRTFDLSHPENITQEEFKQIFNLSESISLSIFGDLTPFIDELELSLKRNLDDGEIKEELKEVVAYLKESKVDCQFSFGKDTGILIAHGVKLEYIYGMADAPILINVKVDPLISQHSLTLLDNVRHLMPTFFNSGEIFLKIKLIESVNELKEAHRITSRFFNTEINLCDEEGDFRFRNLIFNVDHDVTYYVNSQRKTAHGASYVKVRTSSDTFEEIPIYELLRVLFESGVLYVSN